MKKSAAISKFNELYDATYDDALAFVSGKTGNIALADDILTDTYSALYIHLTKIKAYDLSKTHEFFLTYLKSSTNIHQFGSAYAISYLSNRENTDIPGITQLITSILDTDIEISKKEIEENLLLKKINAFVLQKEGIQRKAFVLHYYCGYPLEQVSQLLGVPVSKLGNYIYKLLEEIKINFLSKYILE